MRSGTSKRLRGSAFASPAVKRAAYILAINAVLRWTFNEEHITQLIKLAI
jgi:hypothetical protein